MSDCCFVSLSVILILAPAVLAQPGALELVSVSQSVSESVRSMFFMSKRPSLLLLDSLKRQLYSHSVYSTCVHTTQKVCTTQSGIEDV